MRRSIVSLALLAALLAGCGGSTRTTSAATKEAPQGACANISECPNSYAGHETSAAEAAKEAREREEAAREEARTAALKARTAREEAANERHEQQVRAKEEAREAAANRAAKESTEATSGWSGSEGAKVREEWWQHYMAAMPAGESTAHWKAIGECSLKKLEGQFTPADFLSGDSHISVTEIQDGAICGAEG